MLGSSREKMRPGLNTNTCSSQVAQPANIYFHCTQCCFTTTTSTRRDNSSIQPCLQTTEAWMDFKKLSMKLKMTFPFSVKTWALCRGWTRKGLLCLQKDRVMEWPGLVFGCEEPKGMGIITGTLHGKPWQKSSEGLQLSTLSQKHKFGILPKLIV